MMLEALRRVEASGQPFARVFRQQWVLTRRVSDGLPGFTDHAVGEWRLSVGPGLDIALARDTGRSVSVAVLGHAVDDAGAFLTSEVLDRHLRGSAGPKALAEKLCLLAGRYAFVIVAPGFERLYLDPSSCLGAVYEPAARRVASSLFLTLEREIEPDRDYPVAEAALIGAGRFAFGRTGDATARRLLANHFLDLESFSPRRHWPPPDLDLTCPMDIEAIRERVEIVIARHRQILGALAAHVSPTMLPVSGGDDSRLLLALTAGLRDRIDLCFVHKANRHSRHDVAIACELAARLGVDLEVFDVLADKGLWRNDRFARRMNVRRKIAMGLEDGGPDEKRQEIEVRMALPKGGTVLRGNVTDVSKAVLWRDVGIREFLRTEGRGHDPGIGVRLLMLGPSEAQRDPWCIGAYTDWMDGLPENTRCRAFDFASIEHFRTHGQGALFYATNRNFYQTPSADRTILAALISIPPHLRDAFYVNDLIIETIAPEIADVRFARDTANAMRARRPPLADVIARGPEFL